MLATADTGTPPLVVAAIVFGALGAMLIIAGALALLGLHARRFVARTLLGVLLLAAGALAGTIAAGMQGYRAFTREEVAARLSVRPTGSQHFAATVRHPDGRENTFLIAGDEVYVDAHILKWKPIANVLGLHTAYELDRIGGRYRDIDKERRATRTIYPLRPERTVDLFDLRRRYDALGPLLDADYGSATFVAVTRQADLEVRVSTTGLLIREAKVTAP